MGFYNPNRHQQGNRMRPENYLTVPEICRKLKPIFGKRIDVLFLRYTLSDDLNQKREIEQTINALYQKHLSESLLVEELLLEPPEQGIVNGEYPLGKIVYANKQLYTFGLRESDWPRHVCITGMSGSGKTNFAFQILFNFIKKQKPFIAFDWKKSFRPLMLINEEILCFTVGTEKISNYFKLNINKPPKGVPPKEWINILCDILNESFSASFGVHKLLSETLDRTFTEFKVYEGSENYPTWYQIKDRLNEMQNDKKFRGRESEWLESALRIAHSLTFGAFGEALNYKGPDSLDIEKLMSKKIIFELNSLDTAEKKFFCEYMLTHIFKLKKANYETKHNFESAILIDEAHNILLKDKPSFMKETVTEMIYREIREYGVSLICLDQHISKLSDVVAGNSACEIAFQQTLPQDVDTIANIMQMYDRKKFFSMLPVGSAVVKLVERFHLPFIITTPLIPLREKIVTNEHVHNFMTEKMKNMKRIEIFNESVKDSELKKKIEDLYHTFGTSGVGTTESFLKEQLDISNLSDISEEENKFINAVKQNPGSGTAEIYKLLGVSARKGNILKSQVMAKGLIKEVVEKNDKGWKKILEAIK